jgi:hypothetical protein
MDEDDDYEGESIGGNELDEGGDGDGGEEDETRASERIVEVPEAEAERDGPLFFQIMMDIVTSVHTTYGTALCQYCEIDFVKRSENHKVCPNPTCQEEAENDRKIKKRKNAKIKYEQDKREEAGEAAAKEIGGNELEEGGDEDGGQEDETGASEQTVEDDVEEEEEDAKKKIQKITYERERKEEAEEAAPYVPNKTPTRHGTALCQYCEIDFIKQSQNHKICPNPRCQAFLSSIKGERDKQKKKRQAKT